MKKDINKYEVFNSVAEFKKALNSREKNSTMKYKDSSTKGDFDFTGTNSYEEADKFLSSGDLKAVENLSAAMIRLKGNSGAKVAFTHDVAGILPNIPRYLAGESRCMISPVRRSGGKNIINIFVGTAVYCGIEASKMTNAGAKIANVILGLEKKGIRVNLYAGAGFTANGQKVGFSVNIKKDSAPLNRGLIAYCLTNPSFFRRHAFRWLERFDGLLDLQFCRNYGYPLQLNELVKDFESKTKTRCVHFSLENIIDNNRSIDSMIQDCVNHLK